MTSDDPILVRVRSIIERITGAERTPAGSGPDTPLGDGFWLDSIDLLEVLVACELEFGVVLDDTSDVESGAFGTLGTLTELIRSRQSASPREP
jgi:acyl carrier protein